MTLQQREQLVSAASEIQQRAHAPYSGFKVGAALLSTVGQQFVGCNVENASYSLTTCAEQVAITSAIAAGQKQFAALAIASTGGVTPCGGCRQVLAEFCSDLPIFLVDTNQNNAVVELKLADLLPHRFGKTIQ